MSSVMRNVLHEEELRAASKHGLGGTGLWIWALLEQLTHGTMG